MDKGAESKVHYGNNYREERLQNNIDNTEAILGILKKIKTGEATYADITRDYGIKYGSLHRLCESMDHTIHGEELRHGVNSIDSFDNYMLSPEETIYTMVFELRRGEFCGADLPYDYAESMDFLLEEKLTEKERGVLYARAEGRAFSDIGKENGFSREYARRIANRALGKLRSPESIEILRHGVNAYLTEQKLRRESFELAEAQYQDELDARIEKCKKDFGGDTIDKVPIQCLHLSTRSENGLIKAGCKTVHDACQMIIDGELDQLHYLGQKSVTEVNSKCMEYMQKYGCLSA